MADKMTTIRTPFIKGTLGGSGQTGYMNHGEKTVEEMVKSIRSYADHLRAEVAAIDATPDTGFHVYTHRGVHVQRDRKVLQEGHADVR